MYGFESKIEFCIQYSVISALCVFSLIYFIIVTNHSGEHSSELRFYKLSMGFAALCSLTDILYALRETEILMMGDAVNYGAEILYSLGSICGAYCWFMYSEKKQRKKIAESPMMSRLCAVPFIIMCLFTVTTPLHGLCFSISGTQYVRGVLNVPFTAVCVALIMATGIDALICSFRKEYHTSAVLLRMLFLYAVIIAVVQVLQVLLGPILPFRSLFATVVFMLITFRGICETITIDALSHINNRFSLNRALDLRISGKENFWLLIIDIDNFKQINDSYGHIRGDEAITYTASAIVQVIPRNFFAARYGGDEFAIIAMVDDEAVVRSLEGMIQNAIQDITKEKGCPFNISITVGYARRDETITNIPDMIEAADRVLYEKKKNKKLKRC